MNLGIYKDVNDLVHDLAKAILDASEEAISTVFKQIGRKKSTLVFECHYGLTFIEDG